MKAHAFTNALQKSAIELLCVCATAAKYLKAHESELQGTVKLLFQPAEEGGAGAKLMLDEGALQGVSAVFALHVWPTAPSGHIHTRVRHGLDLHACSALSILNQALFSPLSWCSWHCVAHVTVTKMSLIAALQGKQMQENKCMLQSIK